MLTSAGPLGRLAVVPFRGSGLFPGSLAATGTYRRQSVFRGAFWYGALVCSRRPSCPGFLFLAVGLAFSSLVGQAWSASGVDVGAVVYNVALFGIAVLAGGVIVANLFLLVSSAFLNRATGRPPERIWAGGFCLI